jgi:hypothetical protein
MHFGRLLRMTKQKNEYRDVIVENYTRAKNPGPRTPVHTRPVPGQGLPTSLNVEVPSGLRKYSAGYRFRIRAKLARLKNGTKYLKSHYRWDYEVLGKGPQGSERSTLEKVQAQDLLTDVEQIRRRVKSKTRRKQLIDARLGQGRFRVDVKGRWNGRCAVTGCKIPAVLRASHIKPWSNSTDPERLNPANGLFLAAHIDALFDRGLISFASNGSMLVSPQIDMGERRRLRLPRPLRRKLDRYEKRFFEYHRRHQFLDGE